MSDDQKKQIIPDFEKYLDIYQSLMDDMFFDPRRHFNSRTINRVKVIMKCFKIENYATKEKVEDIRFVLKRQTKLVKEMYK